MQEQITWKIALCPPWEKGLKYKTTEQLLTASLYNCKKYLGYETVQNIHIKYIPSSMAIFLQTKQRILKI